MEIPEWFWSFFGPSKCPKCSKPIERDTVKVVRDERGTAIQCPHCDTLLRPNVRFE